MKLLNAPGLFPDNNVILTCMNSRSLLVHDVALRNGVYTYRKEFAPKGVIFSPKELTPT